MPWGDTVVHDISPPVNIGESPAKQAWQTGIVEKYCDRCADVLDAAGNWRATDAAGNNLCDACGVTMAAAAELEASRWLNSLVSVVSVSEPIASSSGHRLKSSSTESVFYVTDYGALPSTR